VVGGLKALTAVLQPGERELIADYFGRRQTLREIGARRRVCESRMSQLLKATVEKLRERAEALGGYAVVAAELAN
jgi:DNA-directed RNA polymerase specialized sigma subunit